MARIVVAIDGPAGAGKSTITKELALQLGYELLDTGAIYRTVALLARRRNVSWQDEAALAEIASGMEIGFVLADGVNRVQVAGEDVTEEIRVPEMSTGASEVSALPAVRTALLSLQRLLGARGGIVAEGRDVGTVVFPDARAKFFLTASAEVRAKRRYLELEGKGLEVDLETTLEEIRKRDERDSNRAVAPLVMASDAVLIDCSYLAPHEVVESMLAVVREREAGLDGSA